MLVKLALSGLNRPVVPEVFHLLRDFSQSIGRAISLQQARLQKEQGTLMSKVVHERVCVILRKLLTQLIRISSGL